VHGRFAQVLLAHGLGGRAGAGGLAGRPQLPHAAEFLMLLIYATVAAVAAGWNNKHHVFAVGTTAATTVVAAAAAAAASVVRHLQHFGSVFIVYPGILSISSTFPINK